jgi:hypothetical protein
MPRRPDDERPRQRQRRRKASAGGTLLGLLLAGGLVFVWYGTELGWAEFVQKVFQPADEKPQEAWRPPTGGRVVEGEAFDYTPAWERDPRWAAAYQNGEAGKKLMEEAVDRHFNGERGDPFRLRAETEEASELLEKALADLDGLAAEFADSKAAVLEIGKLQRRYGKVLEDRGPKAR